MPVAGAPNRLPVSGDVGRYDAPLVPDPAVPPACDFIVVESTYGDRLHPKESPRVATSCTAAITSGWAWPRMAGPHEPT